MQNVNMPRLNNGERNQAIGMVIAGNSNAAIARQLHVHPSTITRLRIRFIATGSVADRPRPGAPPVTSARQDRNIRMQHIRNRFQTAAATARVTQGNRRRPISGRTVRRRLSAIGLKCRRPYKGPILTHRHRLARQRWAVNGGNIGHRGWHNVVFSDESRFNVSYADGRQRVYRRNGERYSQACVLERDRFGGGSVMVWGAINSDFRSELVVVQRNLNAVRYVNDILRPVLIPLLQQHGRNRRLIFQQDNARPHSARHTRDFLHATNTNVMDWPSLSPDMNPIEHMWDELGRPVHGQLNPPQNVAELTQALQHHWAAIPQAMIRRLCNSMPRRLQAVIRSNGGHTRY